MMFRMQRIAAFGGVYANPWAARATIDDARARGCTRLVCLGDLGGFGARPDEAARLLLEEGVEIIAGNYDLAIASGADDCGCGYADPRDNHYAQVMYDFTREATSPEVAAMLGRLPAQWREDVEGVDLHMVHGSPLAVNDFMWESLADAELAARSTASGADVLVCTHTGIPWTRTIGDCTIVNCGTVGRSANDGDPGGRYALIEIDDGAVTVEIRRVAYDPSSHAAAIREAGLPAAFAETARTGWWTTCLEVVPPRERSYGRFHCYREALPGLPESAPPGWASAVVDDAHDMPTVSLFGSPAFPARLWIYTNFHCNLACGYCAVASSPGARARSLGAARIARLVGEAAEAGFEELYLTGGEPFLEPDIADIALHAASVLPTTLLTNAMLFSGRRGGDLRRLARAEGLALQTSLDGATAARHDAVRGRGSFERTVSGIRAATDLGIRVLVSTTATDPGPGELDALTMLLDGLGVERGDHAVRPLVARGFSQEGVTVDDDSLVPELTVTADGLHWHPVGADRDSSPDLVVAYGGDVSIEEGKRLVVERILTRGQADGSFPAPLACAI